jgi:uncharacterized protein YqgV (UPF0045/DUF77 family)
MLMAFSVTPLGTGQDAGEIAAEAARVVRVSGLPHRTEGLVTIVEGANCDEIMAVVRAAVEAAQARAPRVSLVLHADLRPGVIDAANGRSAAVVASLVPRDADADRPRRRGYLSGATRPCRTAGPPCCAPGASADPARSPTTPGHPRTGRSPG